MEDFVTRTLEYAVRHCGVGVPKDRPPVDPDGTLHFENGQEVPLPSLLSGYVRACEREDDKDGTYRSNYVALVCSAYISYPDVKKDVPLKPMLASKRWIDSQKIPRILSLPRCDFVDGGAIVQDLGFVVVIDDGKRIEIVTSMHLDRWNMTFPEVFEMASRRLGETKGEWDENHPTGCRTTSGCGDGYESTRVALASPDVFNFKKERFLNGNLVAVFGTAKCAFVTVAKNLLGLCYQGDLTLDIKEKHALELLSTVPYRLTTMTTGTITTAATTKKKGTALTCANILRRIRHGAVWTRYVCNRGCNEYEMPTTRNECERVLDSVQKCSKDDMLRKYETACRETNAGTHEGLLLTLATYYAHRAPHLLPKIPAVLDKFCGKLTDLVKKVAERYGDAVPWRVSTLWTPPVEGDKVEEDTNRRSAQSREAGNVEFRNGNWNLAVFHYRLAHRFAPGDPAPLSNLAAALLKLDLHADALVASNRALAIDKTHAKARYRSGLAKLALDDFGGALADLEMYRASSSSLTALTKGSNRRRWGGVDKKIDACRRAVEADVSGTAAVVAAIRDNTPYEAIDVKATVRSFLETSVGWQHASDAKSPSKNKHDALPGWIPDLDRVCGAATTCSFDATSIARGYAARVSALKLYNLVRDSETSKWDVAAELAQGTTAHQRPPPPPKSTRVAALRALSNLSGERSLVLLRLANPGIMSKKNVFSTPLEYRSLPQILATIMAVKELHVISNTFQRTAGADPAMKRILASDKLRFRARMPGHGNGPTLVSHIFEHLGLEAAKTTTGGTHEDEIMSAHTPKMIESKMPAAESAGDTKEAKCSAATTLQSIDQSTLNELTLAGLLGPNVDSGNAKRPSIFYGGSGDDAGEFSSTLLSETPSLSRRSVLLPSTATSTMPACHLNRRIRSEVFVEPPRSKKVLIEDILDLLEEDERTRIEYDKHVHSSVDETQFIEIGEKISTLAQSTDGPQTLSEPDEEKCKETLDTWMSQCAI
eukprot:g1633.t1